MEKKTQRNTTIKILRHQGMTYADLSKKFDISPQAVWGIINTDLKKPTGIGWQFVQQRTFELHKSKCSFCSSQNQLMIMFIDEDKKNRVPENLLLICRKCRRQKRSRGQKIICL